MIYITHKVLVLLQTHLNYRNAFFKEYNKLLLFF